jgi:hypothetical protein
MTRKPTPKRDGSPLDNLSFMAWGKPGERRRFWNVHPTGDYIQDCDTGTRLALEYLFCQETAEGGCLAGIVGDMPRELTGVEVGFLDLMERAAYAGRDRAKQIAAYWDRKTRQAKAAKR